MMEERKTSQKIKGDQGRFKFRIVLLQGNDFLHTQGHVQFDSIARKGGNVLSIC